MSIALSRLCFLLLLCLEELPWFVLYFLSTLWRAWLGPRLAIVVGRRILVAHCLFLLFFFIDSSLLPLA